MVWNYRIIQRENDDGTIELGIHEVYYENESITAWSADSIKLQSDSYANLEHMKVLYILAFNKPILIEKDLEQEIFSQKDNSKPVIHL